MEGNRVKWKKTFSGIKKRSYGVEWDRIRKYKENSVYILRHLLSSDVCSLNKQVINIFSRAQGERERERERGDQVWIDSRRKIVSRDLSNEKLWRRLNNWAVSNWVSNWITHESRGIDYSAVCSLAALSMQIFVTFSLTRRPRAGAATEKIKKGKSGQRGKKKGSETERWCTLAQNN